MQIPSEPVMLLSYINTQLRDFYKSLDDLCISLNLSKDEIILKLMSIDYFYNESQNKFI